MGGYLIRELGNQGRIEILRKLKNKDCSIADITEIDGVSLSTASRILSKLEGLDIVEKSNGKYRLTGFGVAVEKILTSLECVYEYRDDILELSEFISVLPSGFVAGFHNLKRATVMDVESALRIGIDAVANARDYGLYVDKVISYDVYRLMAEKNLEGVSERVISNHETLFGRRSMFKKVLMDMDLCKEEYEIIKNKVEIRILDTPIQLGVIDGRLAVLQLNDRTDRIYVSSDRDFIRWCEYLFWYLWERAENAEWGKIVDEVMVEKGLV